MKRVKQSTLAAEYEYLAQLTALTRYQAARKDALISILTHGNSIPVSVAVSRAYSGLDSHTGGVNRKRRQKALKDRSGIKR